MNNAGMLPVISNQIIIIVIEYGRKRIYEIPLMVFTIYALVLLIEIKIIERKIFIVLYSRIDLDYSIKDNIVSDYSSIKQNDIN